MNAFRSFLKSRSAWIEIPTGASGFKDRISGSSPEQAAFAALYDEFDGERDWGAWFPGFRKEAVGNVIETMRMTEDSWEWIEEKTAESCFMRGFIPFISSIGKSGIGPLFFNGAALDKCVIEYHYESGEITVWSRSVSQFVDAFFELASRMTVRPALEDRVLPYFFTEEDRKFLGQWAAIEFPVHQFEAVSISDLLSL